MTLAEELGWEKVADSLHRYAVPGGWLYRVFGVSEGTTFVPKPETDTLHAALKAALGEVKALGATENVGSTTWSKPNTMIGDLQGDKVKLFADALIEAGDELYSAAVEGPDWGQRISPALGAYAAASNAYRKALESK